MTRLQQCATGAALYLLLGLTLLLYWPGLHGPLILDDISNLGRLQNIGPIHDASGFFRFVLSNSSRYPSRPLSYASFLINDLGWPLYVPAHKYTNVLIHLVNGVLVFWLSWLLCRLSRLVPRTSAWVSLTATALWLLAPLQVSAVLYLIQRMTELSALFALSGLITYCYGRRRLNTRPVSALVQMTAGIGVFGILGFLCKENAVLLGLYALVLEYTLLKAYLPIDSAKTRLYFTSWRWLVLAAPAVFAFALIILIRHPFANYEYRPFTAFQRLVSEPRILFDYLQNLFIPIRHGMGIAHDDYMLSTGWLTPPTTTIAVAALLAALLAALYLSRKRTSLFGFAVLWFLAGHLMESSFLPLEPYFEHRNYLPAFGLFFALAYFIWTTNLNVAKYLRIGLGLYLAAFSGVTWQNVDVWTSKAAMGEVWASDHPDSVRAQQIRADVWSRAGRGSKALEILHQIADLRPDAMAPQVQYLLAGCRSDPDNIHGYLKKAEDRIPRAQFDHAVIPTLIELKDTYKQKCPKLSAGEILHLIDTILAQESVAIRSRAVSDLLYVRATVLAGEGKLQDAVSHLYAAFKKRPNYDLGLASVEYLYNLGQYYEALKALDDVRAINLGPWNPDRFRGRELNSWRRRIEHKLKQNS